jgi:DNA-binding NarL/FixJ family response regulator
MGCDPGQNVDRKNILIVDDHHAVRQGLMVLLSQEPDLTVCAAVADPEQALEAIEHEQVDLAIVDISLGPSNGITLTGTLKQRRPQLIVLILSMHEEQVYGERARRAGAAGFVAKQRAGDTILEAIRRVLSGQQYFQCQHDGIVGRAGPCVDPDV